MAEISENKFLLIFIAIFITPLAVFLRVGLTMHFWVNLILYLAAVGAISRLDFPPIGLVPMIHALAVIFIDRDPPATPA